MDLQQARQEIDQVDSHIVKLLAQRAKLVSEIARLKGRTDMVRDPAREAEVIAKVRRIAVEHDFDPAFVEELYRRFIDYFSDQQVRQLNG